MKSVLMIQSQVVAARVGNSVAGFATERLGVPALCLPSVLYGRRPDRGPPGGLPMAPATMRAVLNAMAEDGALDDVHMVVSGYLALPDQADVVLEAVQAVKTRNPKALYLCDPVIGDDGASFVPSAVAEAIAERLVPAADILTPNLYELSALTKARLQSLEATYAAARSFGKRVIVTSAPTQKGTGALYVAPTGSWLAEMELLDSAPKGAGDLFVALFAARLTLGQSVVMAFEAALGAVHDMILHSRVLGLDHLDVVGGQEKLEHPVTWPTAHPYNG
jgi:pyridoxine kinase